MSLSRRAEKGLAKIWQCEDLNDIHAKDPYHPVNNPDVSCLKTIEIILLNNFKIIRLINELFTL